MQEISKSLNGTFVPQRKPLLANKVVWIVIASVICALLLVALVLTCIVCAPPRQLFSVVSE